jgi:putative hemolysin
MEQPEKKFIDVQEVIRSKNPSLEKWMPGFLLNWLKRTVHEEEVNDFIKRHGDKKSFAFVDAVVEEFKITVAIRGEHHIIKTGGCIYAANHPLGGLDGMALLQVLGKYRRDVKFIVNDILLQLKNFEELFIGVNKHGKNSSQSIEEIEKLYSSEMATMIFPAGLVSRKIDGEIRDLMWRKSFISKAKKYNRTVVPVHIAGANSGFFYNLANFRKTIGIKANIEMLYLMDEMYHQAGKTVTVTFGKPIPSSTFNNSLSDGEWADRMRDYIYELGEDEHAVFNG